MPAKGKGFEQSYNAQAAVDTESMLVVATSMAQVATDQQQVEPMLKFPNFSAPFNFHGRYNS